MLEYVHPDGGVAPSAGVPVDVEKSTDTVPATAGRHNQTRLNKVNPDTFAQTAFMSAVYQNKPNMSKREFQLAESTSVACCGEPPAR